ncbi:phytanoyl-CoA dioxygenase [Aquimarina sp. 2201CG5-10]|uniref:phytanoyl-CoA dioxygenase n=1 Tax=Aquimarina callyspongiae TaxID=3098150 RepID=UPI002AB346DD|nr:phytanoyl-CoA dioxygenase [Aquimarina sp. 2201CG5-10]MDY8137431.1 phytanoyl-CoA dioxygenase [Aquimarina sp. 2201CG5-10]
MSEKNTIIDIKKLVLSLLEESLDQTEIEKKLNEIHTHFQEITQITGYEQNIEHLAAIPAAKGKALGLNHAAQCLLDYKRTIKFLKAIVTAIKEKQREHSDEIIHIFYAGCGPYAPFVTLVTPFFKPEEIKFTLLEINKNSLQSSKSLINALEATEYIDELYLADAVAFKVTDPQKYHILISETLDSLLYRECYVPILFNLLPQFDKNVTLIPENVLINLTLLTHSLKEPNYKEHDVGSILNVRETVVSHDNNVMPSQLSEKKIDLTSLDMENYKNILLDTQVHIYDDIWLYRNESSLTIPFEMKLEKPSEYNSIIFTYYLEPEVELKCRFE